MGKQGVGIDRGSIGTARRRFRLVSRSGAAALSIAAASPALAQQQDEQFWLQVNTNVPITHDVRLTLEQVARFSDRQDGLYLTEFGGLLAYRAAKKIELGFGYRRTDTYNGNTAAGEHRLRQHVVATFGPLTTRLRMDERFSSGGPEVGFRFRPLVRYNYKIFPRGPVFFASHESFFLLNDTSWGQRRGYERMRNMIGVTLPVVRQVNADIGYLNQYRFVRDGKQAQMDHVLSVQLTINLAAAPAASVND